MKRAWSEVDGAGAPLTSDWKFARGQAQATRLQRLGFTAGPSQAKAIPTRGQEAANKPAARGRQGFKLLVAQVTDVRGTSKQKVRVHSDADVNGQMPERGARRAKVGTAERFPIHEVAVLHSMADSDSEEDPSSHRDDATWWDGVEALIDVDLKADHKWWDEIEVAIKADEVVEASSSFRESSGAGGKRELSVFQCTGDAKRVRRPG